MKGESAMLIAEDWKLIIWSFSNLFIIPAVKKPFLPVLNLKVVLPESRNYVIIASGKI